MLRWLGLAATLLWIGPAVAFAEHVALHIEAAGDAAPRIDGSLGEWRGIRFAELGRGRDGTASYALAYTPAGLFIGLRVVDDRLVRAQRPSRRQDAVVLTLAAPRGTKTVTRELWLFAGVPGKQASVAAIASPGKALRPAGGKLRVVEGPRHDRKSGYVLEAFVPWNQVLPSADWRALAASLRLHDVDDEARGKVTHRPATSGPKLPRAILAGAEVDALQAFADSQGLVGVEPVADIRANLHGDGATERVVVLDRFVVLLASAGGGFQFARLGVASGADVLKAEAKDLTADGHAELLLTTRQENANGERRVWQVLSFSSGAPQTVLAIELGRTVAAGRVDAKLELRRGRRGRPIEIVQRTGKASPGLSAETWRPSSSAGAQPILLPWGEVKERRWQWDGARFATLGETTRPSAPTPSSGSRVSAKSAPAMQITPSTSELIESFRRERGIGPEVAPRFAQRANVGGSKEAEEVLVLGRALVIAGTGVAGGGYFFFDIPVEREADLVGLRLADLTADGRSEALVFIRRRQGEVTRTLLLVYQLKGESFSRLVTAEVGRRVGRNRITNKVHVVGRGKGARLEIRPGCAAGWAQDSYPFADEASEGMERMLLPWKDRRVRYRYRAGALTRS